LLLRGACARQPNWCRHNSSHISSHSSRCRHSSHSSHNSHIRHSSRHSRHNSSGSSSRSKGRVAVSRRPLGLRLGLLQRGATAKRVAVQARLPAKLLRMFLATRAMLQHMLPALVERIVGRLWSLVRQRKRQATLSLRCWTCQSRCCSSCHRPTGLQKRVYPWKQLLVRL
ncbi:hypothetical protein CLOP_g3454, partial [Closterium sp. NIES-67]